MPRSHRHVVVGDHDAYLWHVIIDDVEHHLAWWPADGSLRWSYQRTAGEWSTFMTLGPRYSPRHDLLGAAQAISDFADSFDNDEEPPTLP